MDCYYLYGSVAHTDERIACTRHLNVFCQCSFSDIVKITLEEYKRKRISGEDQEINKVRERLDERVRLKPDDVDVGPFEHSVSVCRGLLNLTC